MRGVKCRMTGGVRRLAGELCEGDDCGAERETGGDPQRAVHRVDERVAGDGGDLVPLGAELTAGLDRGADVVDQQGESVSVRLVSCLSMLRSVSVRFGNRSSSPRIDVA